MELDEADEIYKLEIERAEKVFLDALKDGKKAKKDIEIKLKSSLDIAKNRYERNIGKIIKNNSVVKEKSKVKEEKQKYFKVEPAEYGMGFFDRIKYKTDLRLFNIKFKVRNYVRKKTPDSWLYAYFIVKVKVKIIFNKINDFIEKIVSLFEKLKDKIIELIEFLKGLTAKVNVWLEKLMAPKEKKT